MERVLGCKPVKSWCLLSDWKQSVVISATVCPGDEQ